MTAGETPLLNVFRSGAILVFYSASSGKTLRVKENGTVEGRGGEGTMAQFKVHVLRHQRVALQNLKHPRYWLRIKDNDLNGKGQEGGSFTEFKLEEHDKCVVFESVKSPGQHIGILESGDSKRPNNTGTGKHARFQPKVIHDERERISSGVSQYAVQLSHGNVVLLESVASGRTLRIHDDGKIDGLGGSGPLAQFVVHVVAGGIIKLQSKRIQERWLQVKKDELHSGKGGRAAEFKIDNSHEGHLLLESVKFHRNHIGVRENGEVKPPSHTGRGRHGQFKVQVLEEQPSYHRVGTSLLQRTLYHGNVVVLYSKASGKTVRIKDDHTLEGRGEEGVLAQFIVHVRRPGVVAFQHAKHRQLYLTTAPDKLSQSAGSSECNFKVKERDGHLVFESEEHPRWHMGVLPNGDMKHPVSTGEGEHGQFFPKVKAESPYRRPIN